MNNDTNRLAQIIANAADKELGTRVLSDGQPRRQDKAAAKAIDSEYLVIRRDELPATTILQKPDGAHLEVADAEVGTWPLRHPKNNAAQQRKYALEYLAAAEAIHHWNSKQEVLKRERDARREELAGELAGGIYEQIPASLQEAIERIIELERKAA